MSECVNKCSPSPRSTVRLRNPTNLQTTWYGESRRRRRTVVQSVRARCGGCVLVVAVAYSSSKFAAHPGIPACRPLSILPESSIQEHPRCPAKPRIKLIRSSSFRSAEAKAERSKWPTGMTRGLLQWPPAITLSRPAAANSKGARSPTLPSSPRPRPPAPRYLQPPNYDPQHSILLQTVL